VAQLVRRHDRDAGGRTERGQVVGGALVVDDATTGSGEQQRAEPAAAVLAQQVGHVGGQGERLG
jgi:hypothetical protein